MQTWQRWKLVMVWCLIVVLAGSPGLMAQESPAETPAAKFSTEELSQMLAPIALYPDALLAQIFMASTYPLEVVQQLRAKAQAEGNLNTTQEQKVIVEQQVIRIEPANPQVIYVPTYNPTVVYGTWAYPTYPPPPIYYPGYYPGAAFAAGAITFGAGMVTGAALAGAFDWHDHDIDIDIDRNINVNRTDINVQKRRTQAWQHNPTHRNGVAYRDAATSQRYGQTRTRSAVSSRAARGYPASAQIGAGQQARTGGFERGDSGRQRRESGTLSGSTRERASQPSRPSGLARQTGGFDRSASGAFSGLGDGSHTRQASQRGQASRSGGFHGGGRGGFGGGRRR